MGPNTAHRSNHSWPAKAPHFRAGERESDVYTLYQIVFFMRFLHLPPAEHRHGSWRMRLIWLTPIVFWVYGWLALLVVAAIIFGRELL